MFTVYGASRNSNALSLVAAFLAGRGFSKFEFS
jgi:hypothetical protein